MAARHHYVPQFYLEGFVDRNSENLPANQPLEPYLWVVDLEKETVRKRSPKKAAQYTGYYDLEKAKAGDKSIFESSLSAIESLASPIIRKLRNNQFQINDQERFNLSNYIGLQLGRVPMTRSAVNATLKKQSQQMLREYVMDDNRLQSKLGDKANSFKELVLSEKFGLTPGKDFVLASALKLGLEMARTIFAMNWTFILASGKVTFFTSDNPVGLLTKDAKPVRIRPDELNPSLEISFPVAPTCALLMHPYPETPDLDIVTASAEATIEMNRRVFPTVQQYIFCSAQEQAEWALKQRPKTSK